jgi:DNA-binding LacI/PurR family transcriptional regulator
MSVRLQDIAAQLNLSLATVSLALRDSPQIGEDTRQRVRNLATELGYVQRARLVPRSELRHITFVNPFAISNFFYSAVLRAAEAECRRQNIALHFLQLEDRLNVADLMRYGENQGILLVGTIDEQIVREVKESGLPTVLVDNNLPHIGLDRVLIENIGGTYQLTSRLIALGHQRIMLLRGPDDVPSFRERMIGYRTAMQRAGLPALEFPGNGPVVIGTAERTLLNWLDAGTPLECTAIVALNDEQAIGVIHQLQDHGVRVPEDISVVGFDDIETAQIVRPALTTCHVPRELLGQTAVRCLIERARTPDAPTQAIVHDTVVVERASTRAL